MKLNQMKKGNMNRKEFEKLSKKWGKLQNKKDFERLFKNSPKSESEIDDGCLLNTVHSFLGTKHQLVM